MVSPGIFIGTDGCLCANPNMLRPIYLAVYEFDYCVLTVSLPEKYGADIAMQSADCTNMKPTLPDNA